MAQPTFGWEANKTRQALPHLRMKILLFANMKRPAEDMVNCKVPVEKKKKKRKEQKGSAQDGYATRIKGMVSHPSTPHRIDPEFPGRASRRTNVLVLVLCLRGTARSRIIHVPALVDLGCRLQPRRDRLWTAVSYKQELPSPSG